MRYINPRLTDWLIDWGVLLIYSVGVVGLNCRIWLQHLMVQIVIFLVRRLQSIFGIWDKVIDWLCSFLWQADHKYSQPILHDGCLSDIVYILCPPSVFHCWSRYVYYLHAGGVWRHCSMLHWLPFLCEWCQCLTTFAEDGSLRRRMQGTYRPVD